MPDFPDETVSQDSSWRGEVRDDWEARVMASCRAAFGAQLPDDFEPAFLLPYCQGHPAPHLIPGAVELLGKLACPFELPLVAGWVNRIHAPEDLEVYAEVIGLFQPEGRQDWQTLLQLVHAQEGGVSLEQLFGLAGDLGGKEHGRSLAVLGELVGNLPNEADRLACLAALRACRNLGLSLDDVGKVVGRYAREPEAVAALGELAAVLSRRGGKPPTAGAFERLLGAFPNRASAKRFAQVLGRLDRNNVKADALDEFVMAFAQDAVSVEWLDAALSALRRLGRPVDRLALTSLLEWAPDVAALEHYVRGTLALADAGLAAGDIDAIVQPRLGNDTAIAVVCSLRELSRKLYGGQLTRARAERLLSFLLGRVEVKRLHQAISLLTSLGMSAGDVDALAPEFVGSPDDAAWLEALVQQAREYQFQVDRVELVRLRESCPQVSQLYRYCRIRQELKHFKAGQSHVVTGLALDAALHPYETHSFLKVLAILKGLGRASTVDESELRRMYLIHRLPDLVRRRAAS